MHRIAVLAATIVGALMLALAGHTLTAHDGPSAAVATERAVPRTTTLEELRFQLAEACGSAFDPARERFIAALDRAIRLEHDPDQRRYLAIDRGAVLRLKVPPCRSESRAAAVAAPIPRQAFYSLIDELNDSCGDSWSVLRLRALAALDAAIAVERDENELRNLTAGRTGLLRQGPPACQSEASEDPLDDERLMYWFVVSSYFERDLSSAERARSAGDCRLRTARVNGAKEMLAIMKVMGDSVPSSLPLAARLAAQELRPCPDPLTAGAVPPPTATPRVPVAPTGLAGPISAPQIVRNCTSIDRSTETSGVTCRCLGQAQTLSVWGSGPYRAQSSICNAAIHAGVLPRSGMGMVRVVPVSHSGAMLGKPRNGIEPSNWDYGFENAFTVTSGGSDPEESGPFEIGMMSGSFDTELGPMVLVDGKGSFGRENGSTITPTRIAGPVLEGVWEHASAPIAPCADGRLRGRFRFVFTGKGFTGLYASCDNNLNSTWNGTRRKAR